MVSVIIVAGGKGLRMGNDIPKQFIPIGDIPILMRTIDKFHNHPLVDEVIVVLPLEQNEYWRELCKEYDFCIEHTIAEGGETRFHSVKSGLNRVSQISEVVLVHDAVRPFVTVGLINKVIEGVIKYGAVVPAVEMIDSIRKFSSDGSSMSIDRSNFKRIQTPQGFNHKILSLAYDQPYSDVFSDDASVVECLGENICFVDGDLSNIKITTKLDMLIGKAILDEIEGR